MAEAQRFQLRHDGVEGLVEGEAVEFAGIDEVRRFGLFAVPLLPGVEREGFTFLADDLTDREAELLREGEVAFVVGRDAHDGAFAVAHEDVVGDPDFDGGARDRMVDEEARGDALLFHGRHVGFGHAALRAFGDEGLEVVAALRERLGERMLGGDRDEGDAHQGVGTRGVAGELLLRTLELVREGERDAFGAADPVLLHAADLFGPAVELREVVQKLLRVLRDAEVVARDLALFNNRARTPAAAVDHLLVREHGLVDRVPVDDLGLAVGDALFEHLQEHPLVPAVVVGLAGGDLARPVEGETERLHLRLHVGDVVVGPGGRRDVLRDRGVFRRKPEGVPAHRRHHVVPLHAVVPVHDVVQGVVAHVPHVELAARVREHRADVELGLGLAVGAHGVLDGSVDVLGPPLGLDFALHLLGGIGVAHDDLPG